MHCADYQLKCHTYALHGGHVVFDCVRVCGVGVVYRASYGSAADRICPGDTISFYTDYLTLLGSSSGSVYKYGEAHLCLLLGTMASPSDSLIVFYDIPSNIPGRVWSPNTLKTR